MFATLPFAAKGVSYPSGVIRLRRYLLRVICLKALFASRYLPKGVIKLRCYYGLRRYWVRCTFVGTSCVSSPAGVIKLLFMVISSLLLGMALLSVLICVICGQVR